MTTATATALRAGTRDGAFSARTGPNGEPRGTVDGGVVAGRLMTSLVFALVALGCGEAPSAADACGVGVTLDERFREVEGLGATDGYVVRYWIGEAGRPAPASIEELMVFDRQAFRQSDPGEMSAVGTMSLGALTTPGGCVVAADLMTGRSMEGAMLSTVNRETPWVAVVSWPEDRHAPEAG